MMSQHLNSSDLNYNIIKVIDLYRMPFFHEPYDTLGCSHLGPLHLTSFHVLSEPDSCIRSS